jgi:hypothetical protein
MHFPGNAAAAVWPLKKGGCQKVLSNFRVLSAASNRCVFFFCSCRRFEVFFVFRVFFLLPFIFRPTEFYFPSGTAIWSFVVAERQTEQPFACNFVSLRRRSFSMSNRARHFSFHL